MIGIIDFGMGNIKSVANAVYEQGYDPILLNTPEKFEEATHLILPGVGHYKKAMSSLEESGLLAKIYEDVRVNKKPLLGICLGSQLLLDSSEEGDVKGLGLVPGEVRAFDSNQIRVPHVGWNEITDISTHPVLEGISQASDFYFVHSYYCQTVAPESTLATTRYDHNFASIVGQANVIGTQFHPEKSQAKGLLLLENFCEWDGKC